MTKLPANKPPHLLEVKLLGSLHVQCGEHHVDHFQTRQTALLLAFLVAYPRRHSRDEMIDLLWPDADPASGRPRLSQAIWRLRQALHEIRLPDAPEVILADRATVGIDATQISSDADRFRQGSLRAAAAEGAARVQALTEAVAAYGDAGEFLAGFYEDWVLAERRTLQTELLAALESLAANHAAAADWPQAQAAAERAVAVDPLLEESHQALIRILAQSGQAGAARRQYETLVRLLARELNAEPSPATRALMAQIRQAAAAPLPPLAAVPASVSPAVPAALLRVTPLPVPLTTFHGREAALAEIAACFADPATRLLTLLGTGGIGKTRLALEAARAAPLAAFVPLADLTEPHAIAEAIAAALTPVRDSPPLPRIVSALTTAPAAPPFLLVLDNAEHLAEAVGAVVADLLAQIPRLRVLTTSQRVLGVGGEHEMLLPPLDTPGDPQNSPSVRLFLDRARAVRPGFPTDTASIAEVARICERLEGLPLAIELCAGWAQTLGMQEMLEMLDRRFELLVSRRTDIPPRHRTLRAAMEYSYVQLSKPMQEFLVRLSVFRGGWTLAAAAEVCTGGSVAAALSLLAQMQRHSLIVADEARTGDGMRYKMLESLRDFAGEQRTLGQARQHGAAHAAYFARFAVETAARMQGEESILWTARLDDEAENLRAALEYFLAQEQTEAVWTLTAVISPVWNAHGHAREVRTWTGRVLAMKTASLSDVHRLQARLLTAQAEALRVLSEYTEATASADRALVLWRQLGDAEGITRCLNLLGITAMLAGDFDRAGAWLAEALPLARTLGESQVIALVLNDLGRVSMALQDWPTAQARFIESMELRRRLGDIRGLCSSLNNLGLVHRYLGEYAAARILLQEAVSLQNQHEVVWYPGLESNLSTVERLDGNHKEALRLLNIGWDHALAHGERRSVAWCVKDMGHLAVALNYYPLGLRLLACAESLRIDIGMSFKPLGPQEIAYDRLICEQALGGADADANWLRGTSAKPEMLFGEAQDVLVPLLA